MPSHIGVMVLASAVVEIHDNTIEDTPTTGVAVVSVEGLVSLQNGDADFDALGLGAGKSFDLAPHDCAHPPLPPVEVP